MRCSLWDLFDNASLWIIEIELLKVQHPLHLLLLLFPGGIACGRLNAASLQALLLEDICQVSPWQFNWGKFQEKKCEGYFKCLTEEPLIAFPNGRGMRKQGGLSTDTIFEAPPLPLHLHFNSRSASSLVDIKNHSCSGVAEVQIRWFSESFHAKLCS